MPGFAFQRVSYQPSGYQPGYQAGIGIQGRGIQCGIQEIGQRQGQHPVRGSQYAALVRKPVRNKLHQNATGWELVRALPEVDKRLPVGPVVNNSQQGVSRRMAAGADDLDF